MFPACFDWWSGVCGLGGMTRRRHARNGPWRFRLVLALLWVLPFGAPLTATTVIPIPDRELYRRADVVVHGIVLSSETLESEDGRPETMTFIRPLRVWKGSLSGDLVLRQAGGVLPDGRFWKLWGRPEYAAGDEVIVFAIARPEGDFQTAEMLLGKFSVEVDESGRPFAVPELTIGGHRGVVVHRVGPDPSRESSLSNDGPSPTIPEGPTLEASDWNDRPRELARFLDFLDAAGSGASAADQTPVGALTPVVHQEPRKGMVPHWGNINNSLWRYNNGATAAWSFDATANMTGGGTAEATSALAAWTNDPNSNINYTASPSGANPIHLSAASSPCGWSTCITSSGVIGCGGPNGGGSNSWRGDNYNTITGGEVWLRCYATTDAFGSVTTQSVLTHELGHTLGLGHSDQNTSVHDTCRGDESLAIMRSVAQNRTTLGTDDQDAIRWLYGDGSTHCANLPAPTLSSFSPGSGSAAGNTTFTLNGTNFVGGATVSIGGMAATVTNVSATSITGRTAARPVGLADVVVTNPDTKTATLSNGYFYDFVDVPVSNMFHAFVVKIFVNGITAGCGGNFYCPNDSVPRDQMAVFLLRSEHGSSYSPPAATGTVFADVTAGSFAAAWIERLFAEGITSGCAQSPLRYCPTQAVTRAQMAVFLLLAKHGSSYRPPPATGIFVDVPVSSAYAPWIEELYGEGITAGCGGGGFCPDGPSTRGQMAAFLATTFNLP